MSLEQVALENTVQKGVPECLRPGRKRGRGVGENGTDLRGSNGKRLKKGEKKPASGSSQENQAASSRKKKAKENGVPVLPYRTWLS